VFSMFQGGPSKTVSTPGNTAPRNTVGQPSTSQPSGNFHTTGQPSGNPQATSQPIRNRERRVSGLYRKMAQMSFS
jgi:hypothetical protein